MIKFIFSIMLLLSINGYADTYSEDVCLNCLDCEIKITELNLKEKYKETTFNLCKKECLIGHDEESCTIYNKYKEEKEDDLKVLENKCFLGNSLACYTSGKIYFKQIKKQKAILVLKKGCELRSENSCKELSSYYGTILGGVPESKKYLELACNINNNKHLCEFLHKKD